MGYCLFLIALFAGAVKGYCGKKTSGYANGLQDAIFANIIRMLFCVLIGFLLLVLSGDLAHLIPSRNVLLIGMLSGIATAVFVVTWLICVKRSAYMMVDIFLMLGVLIPLIASNILFHEEIKLTQWVGIAVLFTAVVIICSYNNSIKEKLTPASLALLILCGAANGIADFSQKLFTKCVPDGSAAAFNFYTYLFAAFVLFLAFTATRKAGNASESSGTKQIFGYILIMSVCLFVNSYFKTLASESLNAVLLYPLNQGCALILSAVMAAVLFKEKLTAKAIIGILTAFAGLLIINLL